MDCVFQQADEAFKGVERRKKGERTPPRNCYLDFQNIGTMY